MESGRVSGPQQNAIKEREEEENKEFSLSEEAVTTRDMIMASRYSR